MVQAQDLDLSSPAAFVIVAVVCLTDGVIPLVPASAAVIGLGVIAGSGDLRAYPLLGVAAAAAFVSDNISYWLGARFGATLRRALVRGPRSQQLWDWVDRKLQAEGMALVALARVLPGGPTPITLSAGSFRMPARRFRIATAASVVIWSAYALGVGMFGSAVLGDSPLLALLAGSAAAGVVNLVLRMALWRRRTADPAVTDRPV